MIESRLYKKLKNNITQCETCEQKCALKENEVGDCGVRKNIKGRLMVLNYEKAISLQIDPVEKKPLFHFQPASYSLSMATVGCNFTCKFCQNADISQWTQDKREQENLPGQKISPKEIVQKAKDTGCKSIAYTYTEPTVFFEYALDTMKEAHKNNIKNVWVTNGFMSEKCLEKIFPFLDAAAVDLKSFSNNFYQDICSGRLKPVLRNLKTIKEKGVWLEIITLIIPGENDTPAELKKIAEFIHNELGPSTPWHVSGFRPAYKMKNKSPTPLSKIKQAYKVGKKANLKYVYAGNIRKPELTNTLCANCGKTIIERTGFQATRLDKASKCPKCGEVIDIIE